MAVLGTPRRNRNMTRNKIATACAAVIVALLALAWDRPQEKPDERSSETELRSYGVARRGTATVEDAYRQFLSMAANHKRVKLADEVDEMSFEEVAAQLESLSII